MVEHIETGLFKFGREYRMVVSSGEKIIPVTKSQFTFLKAFLANGDVNESAGIAGVKRSTVLSWFHDRRFKEFLKERLQWAADRNGCTFEWAVSELKGLWEGKKPKTKVQMEAMKELNRMLGHIKEFQGGVNAREFINAEYVVIQKDCSVNAGFKPAQIPETGGRLLGEVYLSDVRETVGQDDAHGSKNGQGGGSTELGGLVCDQPTKTGQGHDLAQATGDSQPIQG